MSLQIGIVGLPNVGKSTLFRALTRVQVPAENYPFCTIDPNVGCVSVPDERLAVLTRVSRSEKTTPTMVEFVDIAGLVAGAHEGEGLGNQFLAHIREVDAIAEVVRVFDDGNVIHVAGRVDPVSDVGTIELELAMADLVTVRKRLDKTEGKARTGDKSAREEVEILKAWEACLNDGKLIRRMQDTASGEELARELHLLTAKPLLYVLNVDEAKDLGVDEGTWRERLPFVRDQSVVVLSAKIEAELVELDDAVAAAMRAELGIRERGLDRLIHAAYELLEFQTYFTSGEQESRAWTIPRGATAPEAAGKIHTDFQKGFIRAEVVAYQDFVDCGGWHGAKEKGTMRIEGKSYIVQDGDVLFIHAAS